MSAATRTGLQLASLIGGGWLASLSLLVLSPGHWPGPLLVLAIAVRTFLQTGLFIVGHDAMHRVLLPRLPRWNDRIGRLVLLLYALLPYERCRMQHQRHHQAPGSGDDPDFHAPGKRSALQWYARFLSGYLRPLPFGLLLVLWGALAWLTSATAVLLLWVVPLLLSSWQLFLIGTYLPHRGPSSGDDRHRAISLDLPPWLSLLACYHFGYHREHHSRPELAWHQLPAARRRHTTAALAASVSAR